MRSRSVLLYSLLAIGFFLFSPVSAQTIQQSTSIIMNVIPTNPKPGDLVDISLNSFAENLNTSTITWVVNGKSSSGGIGQKSFSLQAPAAGSATTVTAIVKTADGQLSEVSTTLHPAVMDLLWQAEDSYVPPFYRGKALPGPDTFVKVVAMPEINTGSSTLDPEKMTYAWNVDFSNLPDQSGYGKNFMVYKNNYLDTSDSVYVTAASTDGKYTSDARLSIAMYSPEIIFYDVDPGLGVLWDNVLQDYFKVSSEASVRAAPYFISPVDIRRPDLVFDWSINDTHLSIPNYAKIVLPLKTEAGSSGIAKLGLDITNTGKIFEEASKEIYVQF